MLKAKVFTFGLIVTLAMAFGAYEFLFRMPASETNGRDEEKITLLVFFEPEPRGRGTVFDERPYVEVWVGSTRIVSRLVRTKFQQTVQVPKGKKVLLTATQEWGTNLTCAIHDATGKQVAVDPRVGPGDVSCSYRKVLQL